MNFGPPEYSALMVFALLLVIMLAGDSMLKGFISMFIGLFLATIGTDLFSGAQRFTGGADRARRRHRVHRAVGRHLRRSARCW